MGRVHLLLGGGMQVAGALGPGPALGEVQWEPPPWPGLGRCEVTMNFDHLGPQWDTPACPQSLQKAPRSAPFQERWGIPGACIGHLEAALGAGPCVPAKHSEESRCAAGGKAVHGAGLLRSQPRGDPGEDIPAGEQQA